MRIDASGNLLVGESSNFIATSTSATGLALTQDGRFTLSRSGTPMNVGRLGSDGSLIDFWRQGAPVGSIGVSGGDLIIGTGDTGVHFHDGVDSIIPWSVTAASYVNNAIDLGTASYNYKDLYLSGGVVFDAVSGNATSNTLDDYEEGTFTPSFIGAGQNPTINYTTATGIYTKVGRVVHASIMLAWTGKSGGSGQLRLSGLPFASNGATRGVASISYNDNGLIGSNGNILLHTNASSNAIYFMVPDSEFQSSTYLQANSGITTGSGYFQMAITYQTS